SRFPTGLSNATSAFHPLFLRLSSPPHLKAPISIDTSQTAFVISASPDAALSPRCLLWPFPKRLLFPSASFWPSATRWQTPRKLICTERPALGKCPASFYGARAGLA